MAEDGLGPEDLTPDKLPTVRRGYDRKSVARLLEAASRRWAVVEQEYARLLEEVDAHGGAGNLARDLRETGHSVAQILGDAQEASKALRTRATEEVKERLSAAEARAARLVAEAEEQAFRLREDAWETGVEMLAQVKSAAEAMIAQAEAEVLIIRAAAEQDAHRRVADARREASEITRTARFEGERTVGEARRLADRLVADARREAGEIEPPSPPPVTGADWGVKLLGPEPSEAPAAPAVEDPHHPDYGDALADEVASLWEHTAVEPSAVPPVDAGMEWGSAPAAASGPPVGRHPPLVVSGEEAVVEEVEVEEVVVEEAEIEEVFSGDAAPQDAVPLGEPSGEEHVSEAETAEAEAGEPVASDGVVFDGPVSGEAISREALSRQESPEELGEEGVAPEAGGMPEDSVLGVEVSEPPAAEAVPADLRPGAPAGPTEADDTGGLDDLFRRLRTGPGEAPIASPAVPTAPEAPAGERASGEAPSPPSHAPDPLEQRERLLLPVVNAGVRTLRQRLAEMQNVALDVVRTLRRGAAWEPEVDAVHREVLESLATMLEDSAEAGAAAAAEISGGEAYAPPEPVRGAVLMRTMAENLAEDLTRAAALGDDRRARAAELGRVFRVWRNDDVDRWARAVAYSGYHDGLLAGLAAAGTREVTGVRHGRLCRECPAASGVPWDPAGSPPEGTVVPPAGVDCTCAIALHL